MTLQLGVCALTAAHVQRLRRRPPHRRSRRTARLILTAFGFPDGFATADATSSPPYGSHTAQLDIAAIGASTQGTVAPGAAVTSHATLRLFDSGFDYRFASPFFPAPAVDTPFAVVPEPASWALLVIGFGLTGAVVRRRERVEVARVPG